MKYIDPKKTKIALIEDDEDTRDVIKDLLSEKGYTVLASKDGASGVELIKNELPDIILCDIRMPGINGYEVLKVLNSDLTTKAIPFIFISGKSEIDELRKGMLLGADDFLFKPFKKNVLLKAIEVRLAKKAVMLNQIEKKNKSLNDNIIIYINRKPFPVAINSITFISAENQYTSIKLNSGKSIIARKSISFWMSILPENHFLRIHRSRIININYIEKIDKAADFSFFVTLKDVDFPVKVSKRYSSVLRKHKVS